MLLVLQLRIQCREQGDEDAGLGTPRWVTEIPSLVISDVDWVSLKLWSESRGGEVATNYRDLRYWWGTEVDELFPESMVIELEVLLMTTKFRFQ